MKSFYVYILQSELNGRHFYSGFTEDLQARLKKHNAGEVPHMARRVIKGMTSVVLDYAPSCK
ncbi:MAG: GIY-YIG nuclease family protein [Verrucomicrobiia bacterium]